MNTFPNIFESIHKSDIFKDLTSQQFADLLKKGRNITLQPKSILFHQGDVAINFILVNQGRLKLTKLNEQGKEIILRYIGAGELTAAVAVLKNWNYPATAESVEETDVTVWDKPAMIQIMHQYPDIAINLLNIILERIDDLQNRYLEVCTEHVDQRIARSLLRIMRQAGSKTRSGIQIDIPLSRQNIADYSGTTLYTVSRTLSAWEKKDWIKSGREQIVITNPHALVQFAENG
ncbi:MAG: Crp/Fnr family transcriptional regulator [Desulfobacula sp.]|uniref:Crp/Fnr family transcriptional regulator n=1 Tax=Desulfobacula sp. TaxID=2593537 RepID=UPI0025BB44D5|nr:Crp/Fnr family transcriptional regulator [Desulfobacula sp.]MCD4718352.1 Crp/Fnr family transcriptional regulator [Desulfobacula sp.]